MRHQYLLFLVFITLLFSCNQQDTKKTTTGESALSKPAFNDTTACIFSEIVYCPGPQAQLDKYLPGWKIVWSPLSIGGNYAFVATDSTTYVLAIRGSLLSFTEDAFNNWIYHDLNVATQNDWPYSSVQKAKISQGAYIAWQNLERMRDKTTGKSLWTFLSEKTGEKPLIVTGHSLGGNLATVYASYLWSKFDKSGHPKNNINVITFAAPAPGNRSFADDFNTKFPASERIENRNDIVPKFPCSGRITKLADLYTPGPSAGDISIGYNNITTKLSNVFTVMSSALAILELQSNFSGYTHTNGDGKLITIALSGKDTASTAASWFAEAGYQHSMAQYATFFNAPVISCQ
jgi:triacylglycerol lipase